MRILALTCALSLLGAGVAAADEPSRFVFDAEANAFPITATSGDWTSPPTNILVRQRTLDGNLIRVDASKPGTVYTIELSRHDGQALTPGTYTDQKALVINWNLGCVDDTADFTIDHLDLDNQGVVTAFDGSVEHHCGTKSDDALRAKISYRR